MANVIANDIRLSPKQQAFVQAIVKGATYAQAYRIAKFDGSRQMSDTVASSNASRMLRTDVNVQSAIKMSREELRVRSMLEAADLVEMLRECRAVALEAQPPQVSAAVAAVMGIGKLLGLAVDRSEAHVIHHKPAPLPTALVELSEGEWKRQFDPSYEPSPTLDFLD